MTFVQLTPGAGAMYCGNCLRDNALVGELRRQGHDAMMLPLYLPLTLDETDESAGRPIFFGGVNVFLDQQFPIYRQAPGWLRRCLDAPALLRWAAGRTAKTRAAEVGELTLSMLRGETGNQTRELDELIDWLRREARPDVVCLSNALLLGLAHRLRRDTGAVVLCLLAGEDGFLDAMTEPHRAQAWRLLSERARDVDRFLAPSQFFGNLMSRRLGLAAEQVAIVPGGIDLAGYGEVEKSISKAPSQSAPVLGYFARMCPEKGLDTLVEAFILLKQRGKVKHLKLRIGGSYGPADEPFVKTLRRRLGAAGYLGDAGFLPNLSHQEKIDFLRSLSVFSVPARSGEAFGLYLVEAMAAGVPVVQPRTAAFPELVETTGGGRLCEPENPAALADAVEALLLDPVQARQCGEAGRRAAFAQFSAAEMARRTLAAIPARTSTR